MVTRNDVATRAGVSTAVVSYVLNDGPRPVAEQTRARVLAAMRDLNYHPNGVARSLRTARTRAVGLVVPDVANAFFAQLAREIEVAAFAQDVTMLLGNAMDDPRRELQYVQTFVERRVEGLVLAPSGESLETSRALLRARMPVVVVDRDLPGSPGSTVVVDNHHGGYLATRHLIDHGHRRVAILSGPAEVTSAAERRRGWAQAMDEAGLPTQGLAIDIAFTRESAYRVALELLGTADRPTALFATADEQALGIFRAAAARGLAVHRDLAVVSFDSTDAAPYLVPALTAVHQPTDAIAARAVEVLLAQITDPDRPPSRDTLPVELVVRDSCGCGDTGRTAAAEPAGTRRAPPRRTRTKTTSTTSTRTSPARTSDPRRNP